MPEVRQAGGIVMFPELAEGAPAPVEPVCVTLGVVDAHPGGLPQVFTYALLGPAEIMQRARHARAHHEKGKIGVPPCSDKPPKPDAVGEASSNGPDLFLGTVATRVDGHAGTRDALHADDGVPRAVTVILRVSRPTQFGADERVVFCQRHVEVAGDGSLVCRSWRRE